MLKWSWPSTFYFSCNIYPKIVIKLSGPIRSFTGKKNHIVLWLARSFARDTEADIMVLLYKGFVFLRIFDNIGRYIAICRNEDTACLIRLSDQNPIIPLTDTLPCQIYALHSPGQASGHFFYVLMLAFIPLLESFNKI